MIHINKLLFGLSICLLLTSCDSPRKSKHTEPVVIKIARDQIETPKYTVKEGDTVGSVAHENNITRADLIKLNDLTPPYELYAGQKLIIKKSDDNIDNNTDNLNTNNKEEKASNNKFELVQEGGLSSTTISNNTNITNNSNKDSSSNKDDSINTSSNNAVLLEESSSYNKNNKEDIEENKTSKYVWPVDKNNKKIIKHFKDTKEYTIIEAPSGTPVKSISDGVVKFAGTSQSEGTLGYGKMVIVKHSNPSRLTLYAKLGNTNVTKGQKVKKGEKIGTVAKNNNLYFYLMNVNNKNKRTYIDPSTVLE